MKIKVTIEETVSQEFEVEVPDNVDESEFVEQKYKSGELVLAPGNLEYTQYMIEYEDGTQTGWIEV